MSSLKQKKIIFKALQKKHNKLLVMSNVLQEKAYVLEPFEEGGSCGEKKPVVSFRVSTN